MENKSLKSSNVQSRWTPQCNFRSAIVYDHQVWKTSLKCQCVNYHKKGRFDRHIAIGHQLQRCNSLIQAMLMQSSLHLCLGSERSPSLQNDDQSAGSGRSGIKKQVRLRPEEY
eukprot:1113489-Pelagomonas_calceolata.AAC.2